MTGEGRRATALQLFRQKISPSKEKKRIYVSDMAGRLLSTTVIDSLDTSSVFIDSA